MIKPKKKQNSSGKNVALVVVKYFVPILLGDKEQNNHMRKQKVRKKNSPSWIMMLKPRSAK